MATRNRTQSLVLTGLGIALIAVGAIIAVPFGPVPFTLQTMMLGIVVCLLPSAYPVAAVGGYLALGCLGLPVFSGMRGGIAVFAGPTGGFLVGFLLAAILVAVLRCRVLPPRDSARDGARDSARDGTRLAPPRWRMPALDVVSLVLFSLVYYTLGCFWFMVSTGVTLDAALAATVIPFLIPDIFKAVAAYTCVRPVRSALGLD